MEDPSILNSLILQLVLILLNAVFACAEIAVVSMNAAKLAKLKEQGNRNAKCLSKLTAQPSRFLSTIQVAITLAGFLGSAFAADNFAGPIVEALLPLGLPLSKETLHTLSLITVTLILSYFTIIFGELVPKRIAMKKSETISLILARSEADRHEKIGDHFSDSGTAALGGLQAFCAAGISAHHFDQPCSETAENGSERRRRPDYGRGNPTDGRRRKQKRND